MIRVKCPAKLWIVWYGDCDDCRHRRLLYNKFNIIVILRLFVGR